MITIASVILSWDFKNQWGLSIGALGIILACICWGIDNNFTRNISSKNPFSIVSIKGLTSGLVSFMLSMILKSKMPDLKITVIAMVIGFFCYGLSIVLYVFAMRDLGSARTSALYGSAPFVGSMLSFILLGDVPSNIFFISLPIMVVGASLLLKEEHKHKHIHELIEHEHRHYHNDGHHDHKHGDGQVVNGYHSHLHKHNVVEHAHTHLPDIHHRHSH